MMRLHKLFFTIIIFIACISFRSYAATEKAELYFYTVDGDEIERLHVSVSEKVSYTFKDPDTYKYLPYEDENGDPVYPDLYYQVTGICWQEISPEGDLLGKYSSGSSAKFRAGEHFFWVRTDNPALTGENLMHATDKSRVYLYFQDDGFSPIDSLETRLTTSDTYTFKDPDSYVTGNNQGLYWMCRDDDGKEYLFESGSKARFQSGSYEFHIVTDAPVTVTFRYPMVDMSVDKAPGGIYARLSVIPGETIQLKRSLGALVWGMTFAGWEELNLYDEKDFKAGESLRITDNIDLDFYAVYEEDENWDPDAIDENTGIHPSRDNAEKHLIVGADEINAAAGIGYRAYITESGTVSRTAGKKQINLNVRISGIPGNITGSFHDQKKDLTSLTDRSNPKKPSSYAKDKYGRPSEDSNISDSINGVLMQDDSAFYMDIYGNSIVYHSSNSRINDMAIAYRRLSEAKTGSFATMVSQWDSAALARYEAIEFALLSGSYPSDAGSAYTRFNDLSDISVRKEKTLNGLTGQETLPEWKDEYMSRSVFNEIRLYKQLWSGWYDEYTDTEEEVSGSIRRVSVIDRIFSGIKSCFIITAYAGEKNPSGEGNRLKARIDFSTDLKTQKLSPHYYNKSLSYTFSSWYTMNGLDGLDSSSIQNLIRIFNALVDHGFSEAMAIGACGNLWQESSFRPSSDSSGPIGIVQWADYSNGCRRKTQFLDYCRKNSLTWSDIDAQIEYMLYELDKSYLSSLNKYLNRYGNGSSSGNITNVELACEAFTVVYEGCTCINNGQAHSTHSDECALASNGKSYQELSKRLAYSRMIKTALKSSTSGYSGNYNGLSNTEFLTAIYGYPSISQIFANTTYAERKSYIVTITLCDGRSLQCNKFIADDLKAALDELIESGFPIDNSTCCYCGDDRRTYSSRPSFHALGLAIDINCKSDASKSWGWKSNPQFPDTTEWTSINSRYDKSQLLANYMPFKDPYAVTTVQYEILRRHGFLWGRDYGNGSRPDLMHFVIGEVSKEGSRAYLSEEAESYYRKFKYGKGDAND